jgi:FtsP/CotA-like multicopper oxidase with cupredoxin domain
MMADGWATRGRRPGFSALRAALVVAALMAVGWAVLAAAAADRHAAPAGMDAAGMRVAGHEPQASTAAAEPTLPGGRVRTYYIAADQVPWNYAPRRRNMVTGRRFGPLEDTYVRRGPARIGSTYLKSLYRQYRDGSFRRRVPVSPRWRHLGFLGPPIQAEVGDTIVVHFKNHTARPASMHPHGVRYAKDSEGALYDDATAGRDKADDAVPPGGTHTYVWQVPERAGPGPADGSSVMWMYHGHSDEVADTYAGLIGPIIVTKRGMARPDGSPKDVDRQFVALFMVANENESPYLQRNMRRYLLARGRLLRRELARLPDDDGFQESNLMHSINGYVYANGPIMRMRMGERVRWYVMSMGSEVDLHTPHWHGNTVTSMGMRTDVLALLAGSMQTVDMQPDDPGIWLFHCHVNDHISAGMLTRYEVDAAPRAG